MARVLITGSTTGLGLAAAGDLLAQGHEVVLHARNPARAADLGESPRPPPPSSSATWPAPPARSSVADQVNALGPIDAVIHNAGIYVEPARVATPEGHARTLAVNVLAPYLLTAWINGPRGWST